MFLVCLSFACGYLLFFLWLLLLTRIVSYVPFIVPCALYASSQESSQWFHEVGDGLSLALWISRTKLRELINWSRMATKWKRHPAPVSLTTTHTAPWIQGRPPWHWPISSSSLPLYILGDTCPYKCPTSTATSVRLKSTFSPSGHKPASWFL